MLLRVQNSWLSTNIRRCIGPLRPLDYTLVFLHLPKTAGLSLRSAVLSAMAGRPQLRIINPVDDLATLANLAPAERERLVLIEGHLYYGVHELISRECRYMTILRQPIERVLSWYSFVREYTPHHLHARVAGAGGGGRSLRECLEEGLSVELDNHMVRMLAGQEYVNVPFGAVTGSMLAMARRNLEGFAAVGITERFDESLDLYRRTFGWRRMSTQRINATAKRLNATDCDDRTLALLHAHNTFDLDLYIFACDLFGKQLRAIARERGS